MLTVLIVVAVIVAAAITATFLRTNRDDPVLGTAPKMTVSSSAPRTLATTATPGTQRPSPKTQVTFDPERLDIGATISYPGGDGKVIGMLRFSDHGETWELYSIDDANGPWSLSTEDVEVTHQVHGYTPIPLPGKPGQLTLQLNGAHFRKRDEGTANFTSVGATDTAPDGRCDYVEYHSDNGSQIRFKRFDDGDWEARLGRPIAESKIAIVG